MRIWTAITMLFILTACASPAETNAPSPSPTQRVEIITDTSAPTETSTLEPVATATPAPITPTQPQALVIPLPHTIYVIPNPVWTATQPPPPAGESGYLWWLNDFAPLRPGEIQANAPMVVIIGPRHQNGPDSQWGPGNTLDIWIAAGEACRAPAPAAYLLRPDVMHPGWAVGVEVVGGPCRGFVGWAYVGAAHDGLP